MNVSRISCVTAAQSPLLCSKQPVNVSLIQIFLILYSQFLFQNIRSVFVSPIRQSAAGNHVALWQAERLLSIGMLAIVPISLIAPSQAADYLVAVSLVMHSHWGLEAIVTDYVRESVFGSVLPKAAHGLLLLFSAVTLAGLMLMAYNDQGLGKSVRKIWALESK